MTFRTALSLSLALLLAPACATEVDSLIDGRADAVAASTEVGLLALLNDQAATTFERLDVDCAIRSDSARNLIKHRDGKDKTPGTGDDDLFGSFAEVDDVKMVGPWTTHRLTMCAWLFGYMQGVGPSLTGNGTALIDGAIGADEWTGAASHAIDVALPGSGTVPATLRVMNDGSQLYLAAVLDADLRDRMVRLTVVFDDDGNGMPDSGEDRIAAVWSPYSSTTTFGDAHVGYRASRASDTIFSSYYDHSRGGSSEGSAATGGTGAQMVIEMAHPLDSADDAHDLSLASGDTVSFSFAIAVLGDEWIETRDWANVEVAGAGEVDPEPVEVAWTLPEDVIAELLAIAEGYRETSVYFEMRFAEAIAYVVDGTPIGYKVIFVQTIDPEGGIQLVVEFELDADYEILSENVYI